MSKNAIIAILAALLIGVAGWVIISRNSESESPAAGDQSPQTEDYYTCPMHPSVRSDRPGACPVCGMALVKKSSQHEVDTAGMSGFKGITLSPTQRVMANVTTTPVERRVLKKEITAVGVVDFAEPNYLRISMRFPGRLEKLYLNYAGQVVRKGDPVADVYSPEAISAQEEYLLALESEEHLKGAPQGMAAGAADLVAQARQKLLRWGFTNGQVRQLEDRRQVAPVLTIYSPISGTVLKKNVDPQHYAVEGEDIYEVADLSTVWMYLDVYEKDIRFVRVGQRVRVTTESYPHEAFTGRVTFIDPVLNVETRTVRVRTEFDNRSGKLKPNMYVEAAIAAPSGEMLVVPASSVMATGKRSVVWVEVQENMFEPRDVTLGASTETYVEVSSGLTEGERVAEMGGFLIDSESALQQPSAVDPHAGHTPKQHAEDTRAKPSAYFKETEKHASGNEAGILVKGRYSPDVIHVKVGKPVKLHFYRDEDADCTNEVVFEELGIRRRLPARETTTIVFTPKNVGEIDFSCGMGMVRGKVIVEKQ